MEYTKLSNGILMPSLGYGVFQIPNEETRDCVLKALERGYRLVDTAQIYGNEAGVGDAIRDSGLKREEIFLTTKVWVSNFGDGKTRESVFRSLELLKTDYLDLCLLHQNFADVYGAWRDMEKLYDEGVIRAIGVSNFYPDRLIDLCEFSRIRPMVNQYETNPYTAKDDFLSVCREYGVAPQAWAPLGQASNGIMEDAVLCAVAKKHGKTPAQVMLRWNLQRGVIVIPKSVHTNRMEENINVFDFELTEEEMNAVTALDRGYGDKNHRDPDQVHMYVRIAKEYSQAHA